MAALAGALSELAVEDAAVPEAAAAVPKVSALDVEEAAAPAPEEAAQKPEAAADALPKYTRDEVSFHYDEGDCWVIIAGKVYDVSPFLDEHPGGIEVIMEYAGLDATSDFEDLPHPPEAYDMLKAYLIGEIA
jgi:cytochrome b involved in lipid metabolism